MTKKFRPKKLTIFKPFQKSKLRLSIIKEGLEIGPKILLGSNKRGKYKSNKEGYWLENYPTPDVLAQKIFKDKNWLNKHLKERKKVFLNLKKYLKIAIPKLNNKKIKPKDCINELIKARVDLRKIRPYNNLADYSYDGQINIYLNFINKIMNPQEIVELLNNIFLKDREIKNLCYKLSTFLPQILLKEYINSILRTELIKEIISGKGVKIDFHHDYIFPAPKLGTRLIEFKSERKVNKKLNKKIKDIEKKIKKENQKKFLIYTKTLILMNHYYKESFYLYRIYRYVINHFIEIIAKHLVQKKRLKKVEDILNLTVDEVIKITKQTL